MAVGRPEVGLFRDRVQKAVNNWPGELDVFLSVIGQCSDDDDDVVNRAAALQHWLLGGEESESVLVLMRDGRVLFSAGAKKIDTMRQIENSKTTLMRRTGKSADSMKTVEFLKRVQSGRVNLRVGLLKKAISVGFFCGRLHQRGGFRANYQVG